MPADVTIRTSHWTDSLSPELRAHFEQISAHAAKDFTSNIRGRFADEDLQLIVDQGLSRLQKAIQEKPITSSSQLASAWNEIVADFYQNEYWGRQKLAEIPRHLRPKPKKTDAQVLAGYMRTFLMPMLVTKSLVLYFGLQYSMFPGQGYGYGLIASISFTLGTFAFFVWKASREEAAQEAASAITSEGTQNKT